MSYCRKALDDLNELRRHRFNKTYEYEEVNITDPDYCSSFIKRNDVVNWRGIGFIVGVI